MHSGTSCAIASATPISRSVLACSIESSGPAGTTGGRTRPKPSVTQPGGVSGFGGTGASKRGSEGDSVSEVSTAATANRRQKISAAGAGARKNIGAHLS